MIGDELLRYFMISEATTRRWREREPDWQTNSQTAGKPNTQTARQPDRQTDRQKDRTKTFLHTYM